LIGAGLLTASFWKLIMVDAGFERDKVLTVAVDSPGGRTPKNRVSAQYDQVLENIGALPGIHSAARAAITPISGSMWNDEIQVDGYTLKSREDAVVYFNRVSPRYFETLGTPLLAGRDFDAHDTVASMRVALINETLAKNFFQGVNPVGKYMRVSGAKPGEMITTQVIGLGKDAKYAELREAILATAYVSMAQDTEPRDSTTFVIRTAGQASGLISAVKTAFASINRDLTLEFGSLAVQVNESLNRERLLATLSGFFGALAVLLSAIGLYGVMSYTVARRKNEIGIRMALGAERGTILWMVLREVLLLVGGGMAIGYAAATAGTRWLASMLYGLSPGDPATLSIAGVVLLLAAALAGYLPAQRAARLDPMTTLREE
jgi:predicted permease